MYDPLVANVGTNNLMGSLRYDTAREAWIYGAAAVPLTDAATFWGGAGAGGRFARRANSRASLGAEVAGHGYSFRDAFVDQVGSGGLAEIIPFVQTVGWSRICRGTRRLERAHADTVRCQ